CAMGSGLHENCSMTGDIVSEAPGGRVAARFAVLPGDANPELAREVAQLCSAPLIPVSLSAFADGETRVRIEADVADLDLYIVQPTSAPTNERLMSLALLA